MRSELCIHDLGTGKTTILLAHDGIIEAPNWHPEMFLPVNDRGRLYRVPLDRPVLEEVPTGRVTGLNNDHGISPDGRSLARSAHHESRKSCIHLMPIEGGSRCG